MDKHKIENLLNECTERLLQGETIEQCLESYPEYTDELRPLLNTVMTVKTAMDIKPRPEFRARARAQFDTALREMEDRQSRRSFGWRPQWATSALASLAVLFIGCGSVAMAGYNSMPDSPLYAVKRATEDAQLFFTFSDLGKAELYTALADRRVDEMVYMADKGDLQAVKNLASRLDSELAMVVELAGGIQMPMPVMAPAAEEQPAQPEILMAPQAEPSFEAAPSAQSAPILVAPDETAPPPSPETYKAVPAPEPITEVQDQRMTPVAETAEPQTEITAGGVGGGEPPPVTLTAEREELRAEIERSAAENLKRLRYALENAPEAAKPVIEQAIQILEVRYQMAIEAVETGE
jgi:hypothetical protein